MALGRKTGGRRKGTRNRATAEARAAAEATGIMPLTYMLDVMRDAKANLKRRDAMAVAAAPYLHAKLSSIDAKLSGGSEKSKTTCIEVMFVEPRGGHADEDE
jgi:hypothetical protein